MSVETTIEEAARQLAEIADKAIQQRNAALKLGLAAQRVVTAARNYYIASLILLRRNGAATESEHYRALLAAEQLHAALEAMPK